MGRAGNGMMYARCHDDSPDGDDSFLAEIEFDNGNPRLNAVTAFRRVELL